MTQTMTHDRVDRKYTDVSASGTPTVKGLLQMAEAHTRDLITHRPCLKGCWTIH